MWAVCLCLVLMASSDTAHYRQGGKWRKIERKRDRDHHTCIYNSNISDLNQSTRCSDQLIHWQTGRKYRACLWTLTRHFPPLTSCKPSNKSSPSEMTIRALKLMRAATRSQWREMNRGNKFSWNVSWISDEKLCTIFHVEYPATQVIWFLSN